MCVVNKTYVASPFSAQHLLFSVFWIVFPQHEGKISWIYEWIARFKILSSTDICYETRFEYYMHMITIINSTISKSTSPAHYS